MDPVTTDTQAPAAASPQVPWATIEGNPKYGKLAPKDQDAVKEDYYSRVMSQRPDFQVLPEDQQTSVHDQFIQKDASAAQEHYDTAPGSKFVKQMSAGMYQHAPFGKDIFDATDPERAKMVARYPEPKTWDEVAGRYIGAGLGVLPAFMGGEGLVGAALGGVKEGAAAIAGAASATGDAATMAGAANLVKNASGFVRNAQFAGGSIAGGVQGGIEAKNAGATTPEAIKEGALEAGATYVGGKLLEGTVHGVTKIPEMLPWTAARIDNAIIKPFGKDFLFGKNPGEFLSNNVKSPDNTLEGWKTACDSVIDDRIQQAKDIVADHPDARVDVKTHIDTIYGKAMDEAAKQGDDGLLQQLSKDKKTLENIQVVGKDPETGEIGIRSAGQRDLSSLSLEDAIDLKRTVGKLNTDWTKGPEYCKALASTRRQAYGALRMVTEEAAPELHDVNSDIANGISASQSMARRMSVDARSHLLGLYGFAGGAVIAHGAFTGNIGEVAAGIATMGVDQVMRSPYVMSRVAMVLAKVGNGVEKERLMQAVPWLREKYDTIMESLHNMTPDMVFAGKAGRRGAEDMGTPWMTEGEKAHAELVGGNPEIGLPDKSEMAGTPLKEGEVAKGDGFEVSPYSTKAKMRLAKGVVQPEDSLTVQRARENAVQEEMDRLGKQKGSIGRETPEDRAIRRKLAEDRVDSKQRAADFVRDNPKATAKDYVASRGKELSHGTDATLSKLTAEFNAAQVEYAKNKFGVFPTPKITDSKESLEASHYPRDMMLPPGGRPKFNDVPSVSAPKYKDVEARISEEEMNDLKEEYIQSTVGVSDSSRSNGVQSRDYGAHPKFTQKGFMNWLHSDEATKGYDEKSYLDTVEKARGNSTPSGAVVNTKQSIEGLHSSANRVLSDGSSVYDFLKESKVKITTPVPTIRSIKDDVMKLPIFDRTKIFSALQRKGLDVENYDKYVADNPVIRNQKMEGGDIVQADTYRGCSNGCFDCFACKMGQKSNKVFAETIAGRLTGKLKPNDIFRNGVNSDPAGDALKEGFDWAHTNEQMTDLLKRSGAEGEFHRGFYISKLQNIKGFDPKIVRNLEVSLDPLDPEQMATTMKNLDAIRAMKNPPNILVRIRSIASNNSELQASMDKAVAYANERKLAVLETRMRFPSDMAKDLLELKDDAYHRDGNQIKTTSQLQGKVPRERLLQCNEEDLLKGACAKCKNCMNFVKDNFPNGAKTIAVALGLSGLLFAGSANAATHHAPIKDDQALLAVLGEGEGSGLSGQRALASALKNNGDITQAHGARHVVQRGNDFYRVSAGKPDRLIPKYAVATAKQAVQDAKTKDYSNGANHWFSANDLKDPATKKLAAKMKLISNNGGNYFYKEMKS